MDTPMFKGSAVYEFTKKIMVDGKPYKAGDRVPANAIPAGCLESCLHTGAVRKLTEAEVQANQKQQAPAAPTQPEKPAAKK